MVVMVVGKVMNICSITLIEDTHIQTYCRLDLGRLHGSDDPGLDVQH